MSLARHDMREELMALLGAARELPPEHDGALADMFLCYTAGRPGARPPSPSLMERLGDWRAVLAALSLALAAFLSGAWLVSAAGHDREAIYTGHMMREHGRLWMPPDSDGNGPPPLPQAPNGLGR